METSTTQADDAAAAPRPRTDPTDVDAGPPTYTAFISYTRNPDARFARAIQRGLHQVAKPWYRLRSMRVFLDESSLSANPALWPSLERALQGSEWLVVLCSPESASAYWVQREIGWWLEHRSADRILLVHVGGEIHWPQGASDFDWARSTALSQSLGGRFAAEPKHVDLRWATDESMLVLRHGRFRSALLDIAATLLDRPKDELDGDDVRQHRRARRFAIGAIGSLALLAVLTTAAATLAIRQRDLAVARQLIADAELAEPRDADAGARLAMASLQKNPTDRADGFLRRALARRHRQTEVQTGHDGPIFWLAIDRSGQRGATGSQDGSVRLWDLANGRPLALLPGHRAPVETVRFSPDGAHLVTDAGDGEVRLWRAADGTLLHTLRVNPGEPLPKIPEDGGLLPRLGELGHPHFSPDGKTLGIRRRQATGLYDVASGQLARDLPTGRLGGTSFIPGGPWLIGGREGADRDTFIWSAADGEVLGRLQGRPPNAQTSIVSVTPDRVLTVGDTDGLAILHALPSGQALAFIGNEAQPTTKAWMLAGGQLFATASAKQPTVRVWRTDDGSLVGELPVGGMPDDVVLNVDRDVLLTVGATGAKTWLLKKKAEAGTPATPLGECALGEGREWSATFAPDPGEIIALISDGDFTTTVWCDFRGQRRQRFTDQRRVARVSMPAGAAVLSEQFSPDGKVFITHPDSRVVVLHRADTGDAFGQLYGHTGPVTDARFSPDGRHLTTVSQDATLRTWDASRPGPVAQFESILAAHPGRQRAVGLQPDGKVELLALPSGEALVALEGHIPPARDDEQGWPIADLDAQARTIAVATEDGVFIWNAVLGRHQVTLPATRLAPFDKMKLSPDGTRLLIWDADAKGPGELWDTRDGQRIARFNAEDARLRWPAFGDNGRQVIARVESEDGKPLEARVWNADTGHLLATLVHPDQGISRAVLSHDGRRAATAGAEGGPIHLWNLERPAQAPHRLDVAGKEVGPLRFSKDDGLLLAGLGNGQLKAWRTADGALDSTLTVHNQPLDRVDISADAELVLTTTRDGVRLWQRRESRQVSHLTASEGAFDGMAAFAADDGLALVWDGRGPPWIYHVATGWSLSLENFEGSSGGRPALLPDGQHLVLREPRRLTVWRCLACADPSRVVPELTARLPPGAPVR